MAGLMNRSRVTAEGVVVMVCPVLLALALDKVDLKVYEHPAFMAMLTMAGITLISGICPVLVCFFSQRFPGVRYITPTTVTAILAILSSSCLLIVACFIAQLIVSMKTLIAVSLMSGVSVLGPAAWYYLSQNVEPYPPEPELHGILVESHEFLTGVTGILFLGLEGLVLQNHDNQMSKGGIAMGPIIFIVCALGVCLMFLEMIPPLELNVQAHIVGFTLVLDFFMAVGTIAVLTVVSETLMGHQALLLFLPPVGIFGELAYQVIFHTPVDGIPNEQNIQPASLELTRVTFTGFLAVSITTAIGDTSAPSKLTVWFLIFAAGTIVSGLSWRLLTQSHIRSCLANHDSLLASSANYASFCTHFCIVIATILFLVMAGTARVTETL